MRCEVFGVRCEVRGVRFSVFGVRCAAAPGVHRSAGSCGQMSVCVDGGGFELQDGGKARGNARARTSYSHKLNPKPLSNPSYVEPQTPFHCENHANTRPSHRSSFLSSKQNKWTRKLSMRGSSNWNRKQSFRIFRT